MDSVYASLLDSVSALLLSEAWGIACQRLWKLFLLQNRVDKLSDHGVLAGSDQVEILSLDLIHHGIHLCKAHNACHHIAADHERRNAVGEASVDHEIPCVGDHGRVESCNIPHQVVKAVSGNLSGAVQIDSVKALHNLCMVWNLKIRHNRLAVLLNLHILAVILSDRNRRIDNVRDRHHDLCDSLGELLLLLLKLSQTCRVLAHLLFELLGLLFLSLSHHGADLFCNLVLSCAQIVCLLLGSAVFRIQGNHLVH